MSEEAAAPQQDAAKVVGRGVMFIGFAVTTLWQALRPV